MTRKEILEKIEKLEDEYAIEPDEEYKMLIWNELKEWYKALRLKNKGY